MTKFFYKLHRKLALFLAIPVILWALSGLLHPMMANWLRPEIAHKFLPPKSLHVSDKCLPPSVAFSDLPELHQFKLVQINGALRYLGITPDQELHYRDPIDGAPLPDAANAHAEDLARAYADDTSSKLLKITKLTEFSSTYGTINRLLPAFRVKLDRPDGLEVVVDPRTGRLASFDTPSKRLFSRLFSWFHTWSFLGKPDSYLRITLVLLVSILSLLTAVSGLVSLIKLKRKKKSGDQRTMTKVRSLHRYAGGFSAIFFFMFGLSGIFHVFAKYWYDDSPQWVSSQKIPSAALDKKLSLIKLPIQKLSLAVIDEQAYYRIISGSKNGAKTSLISTQNGSELQVGDKLFAEHLAREFSGYSEKSQKASEFITKFRKDYGFIFKRLPVWRVSFEDQDYWQYTVDTSDAHMSMRTNALGLAETLSFINLHKFHFLDFAGRNTRDIATAIAVCMLILTATLGLMSRKRRSRTTPPA